MERIRTAYDNLVHRLSTTANLGDHDDIWLQKIADVKVQFETAMDDDFNTANGIAAIFELSKLANTYLLEKQTSENVLKQFILVLDELTCCSGINVCKGKGSIG